MSVRLLEDEYYKSAEILGIKYVGPYPGAVHKKTWWECICGERFYRSYINTFHKKNGYCLICRPAGSRTHGKERPNFNGYEEIHGKYISSIKSKAKDRKITYEVSNEYIWDLFVNQKRKCNLSGQSIGFSKKFRDSSAKTASLDRIDSSKGYVEGNLQWSHKDINYIKRDLDEEYFIYLCCLVADKSRGII